MTTMSNDLKSTNWDVLQRHHSEIATQSMADWFANDEQRFDKFSGRVGELFIDYSRNRITTETIRLLLQLAESYHVLDHIQALFNGEQVNSTENRAALHTALRMPQNALQTKHKPEIASAILDCRKKMFQFAKDLTQGKLTGATGKTFKSIVNIGIGGSYLGPKMAIEALKNHKINELEIYFASTVDSALLQELISRVDPETTLFIISSKTFSTIETTTNASTLATWLKQKLGEEAFSKHFVAVTATPEKAIQYGVRDEYIFPFWEWVGGRYSIWSAIGLPLLLSIGQEQFEAFLSGAYEVDCQFQSTPLHDNMPVLLALISIWYTNFFHTYAEAIIPYSYHLRYFIPYLQQAVMESNGKCVDKSGRAAGPTSPIIFGEEGCNGQHTYHQLLHQGTQMVPADFILVGKPHSSDMQTHHDVLLASALSQAEALMTGKSLQQAYDELINAGVTPNIASTLSPHKVIPGNKPSNLIYCKQLTPKVLGSLIALYEHKIFVQGTIWNINSFDQWGVELGKQLLPTILQQLQSSDLSSSIGMIRHLCKVRGEG